MIYSINKDNPQKRLIDKSVQILEQGGVIIYPTDTVYAYGCDINHKAALEKIYRIKKINKHKPLSFIFSDIVSINPYIQYLPDNAFKIMKKACPGPYTFILFASKLIPKIALTKQKTIGIRIPDNNIALDLVRSLGRPLISASVSTSEGEYIQDVEDLEKQYRNVVDLFIDTGRVVSEPSTIVDFTGGHVDVIREGKGELFF